MMVDTPELMPEPQNFPPVASTSLLEPTNAAEGAHLTTNLVIDPMVTMTTLFTNIEIFEQFVQEYDQQALRNQEYDQCLTPTQSELGINENYCKMMEAVDCMRYIQDRMIMTDTTHLHRHISMVQQMKMFHSIAHSAMPPAVHLARITQTTYMTPLMSQLFNSWQACL